MAQQGVAIGRTLKPVDRKKYFRNLCSKSQKTWGISRTQADYQYLPQAFLRFVLANVSTLKVSYDALVFLSKRFGIRDFISEYVRSRYSLTVSTYQPEDTFAGCA